MRRANRILALGLLLPVPFETMQAQTSRSQDSNCQKSVHVFLAHPSQGGLQRVSHGECWAIVASSNSLLSKLDDWTKSGNQWAAEYLSEHLNNLDGGNLEDALEAMGGFSEHDMVRLLSFELEGKLSSWELDDALTMLPLSLSDNPSAQLRLLKRRRQKLASLTNKELLQQKVHALAAIDTFIAEVKRNNPGK